MERWLLGLLFSLLIVLPAIAQEEDEWADDEEEKGFSIALNIGSYFASKKSANLYNGACLFDVTDDPNGVRCFTIMERLTRNINDVNFINNYYGSTSFEGPIDMHPFNMRYQPAFMFGLNILYDFNAFNAIIIDMNLVQLKAEDQFTLQFIGTGQQLNAQGDIRLFGITGREERFSLNMGYRTRAEINQNSRWYLDIGATMLGASLEENFIRVADRSYQLLLGGDNPQQVIQYRPRTQIGFGAFAGGGVEMIFDEKYRMDIGLILTRENLKLENYSDNVWNWSIVARFGL